MSIDINFGALQTANPFAAYAQGQELGQQQRQRQAMTAAGNVFADDPAQAAQILASSGNIDGAMSLEKYGAGKRAQTARAQAVKQYQTGDVKGAQSTALASGDDDLLKTFAQMSDQDRAAAQERAQNLAGVVQSLSQMPYAQAKQKVADLAQHPEMTSALGLRPEDVANYDPTPENNRAIIGHVLGLAKQIELSKPVEMDPTKNYYVNDLGGGAAAQTAAQPQGAPTRTQASAPSPAPAGGLDAVWQAVKQQESGGNGDAVSPKGALGSTQMLPATAHGMAQKLGVAWRPDLMQGNTQEALAYQDQLGKAYFQEGLQRYGGDVSKALAYYHGGPDQSIWGPKTRNYVQSVLGRVQGGQQADVQPYQVASNGPTPPPPSLPGYHLVQQGGQPWKPDGQGGLINVSTGDRKKDPTYQAPAEKVDPNIVKGLIEGRITPPTQKAAATPYWQAQLEAASSQDPNFDMVNFQARSKSRADFTSGKSAQNITALNTVIGHLDHLDRTIDGLNNTDNLGPLNKLNNVFAHKIAEASGTDSRVKDFETAKIAVANELTRVFRGTGGAEADIQAWSKQLDGASSPQALHKVVQSMAELINSRVQALGEQYSQGMGTTKDGITLLTPDKQKSFQRMMGGAPSSGGQAAAAPAQVIRYDRQGNRVQ